MLAPPAAPIATPQPAWSGRGDERATAPRRDDGADADDDGSMRRGARAPFALAVSLEQRWYTDPGYDVFAADDVTSRFGFWLAYDLLQLGADAALAAEVGFTSEQGDATGLLGGSLESELSAYCPHAGAQLRWSVLSWLEPMARLSGGIAVWSTQLRFDDASFDNDGIAPFGVVSAGVLVRTPSRLFEHGKGRLASLAVGLLIEGGYALEPPWRMRLDGAGPHTHDIALDEAPLGELDRQGPLVRASLLARF